MGTLGPFVCVVDNDVIEQETEMLSRRRRVFSFLASLAALVAITMTCSAFVLADQRTARVGLADPVDVQQPAAGHNPGPLDLPLIGPQPDPRPDTDPDTGPGPDPKPDTDPPKVDKEVTEIVIPAANAEHVKYVAYVYGRTLDDNGNPVPHTSVEYWINMFGKGERELERSEKGCRPCIEMPPFLQGMSDANGEFRLRITYHAPAGSSFAGGLTARHEGYLAGTVAEFQFSNGEAQQDVVLGRGSTVTGRVLDAYGRPVADAQLAAYGPNGWAQARTDEGGYYKLEGAPTGPVQIYAFSENYRAELPMLELELQAGQSATADFVMLERTIARLEMAFNSEFPANGTDYLSGEITLVDAQGNILSFWFEGTRKDGGATARLYLDGAAPGTYRATVRLWAGQGWVGEFTVSLSDGLNNDLGLVRMDEATSAPTPMPEDGPVEMPVPRR